MRFLEAGAGVVICCRHRPDQLPAAEGREAVFVEADVRDPDQVQRVIEECTARFGRLDVLVNNAGGSPPADAATASPRFAESIVRRLRTDQPSVADAGTCSGKASATMSSGRRRVPFSKSPATSSFCGGAGRLPMARPGDLRMGKYD